MKQKQLVNMEERGKRNGVYKDVIEEKREKRRNEMPRKKRESM